jgi:protein phosphatase 1 regulatory subunit 7
MEKENTVPNGDAGGGDEPHQSPRDSKGWDGKLRVEKKPVLQNPEAISDPEYSDEENILPGEQIDADEGTFLLTWIFRSHAHGGAFLTRPRRSP